MNHRFVTACAATIACSLIAGHRAQARGFGGGRIGGAIGVGALNYGYDDQPWNAGFNGGPMLLADGDVFGDTVNLCARLVGLANPGQVLTTQLNVDVLPPEMQARCRQLFPIRVRGREGEVVVCDVQYRSDPDLTKTNFERAALVRKRETVLKITYQGEARVVRSTGPGLRIGRDKTNDLLVDSPYASRLHVRVFAREGHFVLQDLSSNGTYLLPDGGAPEILLRREEAVLSERGWIGLGNTAAQHGDHALRFRVDAGDDD